jgi:hypothetical protein
VIDVDWVGLVAVVVERDAEKREVVDHSSSSL